MKLGVVLLLVSLVVIGSANLQQCKTSSMKIVMKSRYNETGHWQSKVDLYQGDRGSDNTDPWVVDVQQGTSDCADDQYDLHTTILLTAPYGVKNNLTGSMMRPPYVPNGYEVVPGVGIIKKSTRVLSYADAVAECKKDGASILVVDSEAKQNFVKTIAENPAVFVGAANDRDVWGGVEVRGGVWTSPQGIPEREIPYFKWAISRPVDGYCTVFSIPLLAHWDTNACTSPTTRLSYVCERVRR